MEILEMESKSSQPSKCTVSPDLGNTSKHTNLQYLHKVAGMVVGSFAFDQCSLNNIVHKIITAQEKEKHLSSIPFKLFTFFT